MSKIYVLSLLLAVWLVSAWEVGALGCWAWMVAFGIGALWCILISYAEWSDRNKQRRRDRKMARRVMEQTEKEMYLRSIA